MSDARGSTAAGAPAAAPDLEVAAGGPGDDEERDALVRAHPRGTFFHLAGWRRVVARVLGHEPRDLVARRDGRLVGVLPLMRSPVLPRGRALISMPYAVYGGPLGESAAVEAALVAAGQRLAERTGARRLELRCLHDLGLDLPRSELYATFLQDLPADPAEVLASIPKKARAEARKARERHGLRLTPGAWYLEDLHRLFAANKRSLGSPGLPLALFRGLLDEFGERAVVHVVHARSEPVAAVMSFVHEGCLLAYYAGTAPNADRELSASNFMYMALREWAVERGLRRFDFGRSRRDSGACRFKEHQGFEATPLQYRYHLVRDAGLPSFTPSNPRTKVLRDTWSKLPPALTGRLSDVLCRYLA